MIVSIDDLGQGINRDQMPEELPLGVWSNGYNIRARNGFTERFEGIQSIFTASFVPYFIDVYANTTTRMGIYAGLTKIACHDGTTETDLTGTPPTGTVDDKWTGGSYNGSHFLNNGIDDPMFWNGNTATNYAALTGWPVGWKAKSMRAFGRFLFAIGLTRGGVYEPHTVAWSGAAAAGAIPAVWTAADTNLAGAQPLVSPGELVDGTVWNDFMLISKSQSDWMARYIGGNDVFSFQQVQGTGMLARNCAVATPKGIVKLTAGDVVIHNGLQETSIANARYRDWIFSTMNRDTWERSFVCSNPAKSEVLICFPSLGKDACDRAAVWNWESNTWSTRYLPDATSGASGQVPASSSAATWAADTEMWFEADDRSWLSENYGDNDARLVLSTLTGNGLFDQGSTDFGVTISARGERVGLHLGDEERVKLLRAVYLTLDAIDGTQVSVQVGASMLPDEYPTWQAPVAFTKGTSQKVDVFASGRYLAYRLSSLGSQDWRLRRMRLDVAEGGGKF